MYTRCPECQSVFRISAQHLKARDGLVRCGKCRAVFQAETYDSVTAAHGGKAGAERAAADAGKPTRKSATTIARRGRRKSTPRSSTVTPPVFTLPGLPRPTGPHRRAWQLWWAGASVLLILLFGAQLAYLYRIEIAREPTLRPAIESACAWLGCTLSPPANVHRIELETTIAPHPKYANALRIRADLINRADYAQPFPLMEVTLTDSEGRILARRHYEPSEYLPRQNEEHELLPNVVVHTLLDVTNPDNRAVGYEIRLVPRDTSAARTEARL